MPIGAHLCCPHKWLFKAVKKYFRIVTCYILLSIVYPEFPLEGRIKEYLILLCRNHFNTLCCECRNNQNWDAELILCVWCTPEELHLSKTFCFLFTYLPMSNNSSVLSYLSQRRVLSIWAGRLSVHRPRLAHRAPSIEARATLNQVLTVLGTEM